MVKVESDQARGAICISHITRHADRQTARCSAVELQRLAETFERPRLQRNCELVSNLARHRVFHFRVGRQRVSYVPWSDGYCVVDISRHDAYDEFAQHYDDRVPQQVLPIQESYVMTKKHNGKSRDLGKNEIQRAAGELLDPHVRDDVSLLANAFMEIIGNVTAHANEQTEAVVSSSGDRLQEYIDQQVLELTTRCDQQKESLKSSRRERAQQDEDLTRHLQLVQTQVAGCEQVVQKLRQEAETERNRQQELLDSQRQARASESADWANAHDALTAWIRQLSNQFAGFPGGKPLPLLQPVAQRAAVAVVGHDEVGTGGVAAAGRLGPAGRRAGRGRGHGSSEDPELRAGGHPAGPRWGLFQHQYLEARRKIERTAVRSRGARGAAAGQ